MLPAQDRVRHSRSEGVQAGECYRHSGQWDQPEQRCEGLKQEVKCEEGGTKAQTKAAGKGRGGERGSGEEEVEQGRKRRKREGGVGGESKCERSSQRGTWSRTMTAGLVGVQQWITVDYTEKST